MTAPNVSVVATTSTQSGKRGQPFLSGPRFATEVSVFVIVFLLVAATLRPPMRSSNGLVETWLNLTNQMFYGSQDFLFSYGPLYWLMGGVAEPFDATTYWASVVFLSTLCALFWSLLVSTCHTWKALPWLAVSFFLFIKELRFYSLPFLVPLIAIFYLEFRRARPIAPGWFTVLGIGLATGGFIYVRFVYGVLSLAVLFPYFLGYAVWKRSIWNLAVFVVGLVAGTLIVGRVIFHESASIADYFSINMQLSFGNSVDMPIFVKERPMGWAVAAVTSLLILLSAASVRPVLLLPLAGLLLMLFKLGFSRVDHYIDYFVEPVSILAIAILFSRRRLAKVTFVTIMVCLFILGAKGPYRYPPHPRLNAFHLPKFGEGYFDRMHKLYTRFALPNNALKLIGDAPVDVYPYATEFIFANRLHYRHRPLFQSYMTLTPGLGTANMSFFSGPKSPKFVLWTATALMYCKGCNRFADVDNKHLLNEDPLTSLAILNNYHVVLRSRAANGTPFLLFEKNAQGAPMRETLLSRVRMKFNTWYPVPVTKDGIVRLYPHFKFTWPGRLRNLLFRGKIVAVRYQLATGAVVQFRLNILNAASGVWASPLLSDFSLKGKQVVAISFATDAKHYFEPEYSAQWSVLSLPEITTAREDAAPALQGKVPVPLKLAPAGRWPCAGSIETVNHMPVSSQVVDATGRLTVSGWLTHAVWENLLADRKVYVTLTDAAGNRMFAEPSKLERPYVGTASGYPDPGATRFQVTLDVSQLKGRYRLGLAEIYQSRLWICRQIAVPVVIGAQ